MMYHVLGLMSGSSLDGLDLAFVTLTEQRSVWSYELVATDCIPYTADWAAELLRASELTVPEFLRLHTRYGRYLGEQVNAFIERHDLHHRVHFIASHGHTVFHEPATQTTSQIGCGASIAAVTGLPTISDLRAMDVALGGQGAPIVPIGDQLLFGTYPYLLNLGGIANLTILGGAHRAAFDIGPANAVLNRLALREGLPYDEAGQLARSGRVIPEVLMALNQGSYFSRPVPKSLSNAEALALGAPVLEATSASTADLLATFTGHLAEQVAEAVLRSGNGAGELLVTGGGAHNTFLIETLREKLHPAGIEVVVPQKTVVDFKEALVMALIGVLRWREEENVLQSVTGASRNSVGGALWMGSA
ncbi:MAG: anhydro-N-acetylmuramic acid kinase [Sphingobacteriales bacterium]|nr:MAG: anhydro-N-acetylmuramic acid kinase [Sphingobacteriales bacterium]